ncbi:Endonuclease V (EC [Olavius algarvensis associated proteobacterium Delta 3]|nr:Endonuclease V (EC [Olavius algarvensis associated proteobacterium Delta 3]
MKHSWNVPPKEAIAIQRRLARSIVRETPLPSPSTIAGVDVAYGGGQAQAAAVLFSYPHLDVIDTATARVPLTFPYVPGLLSFREGPAILEALAMMGKLPDLILFDGQGIAHPRRLGIASHIGLLVDRPSIGCAKTRLVGAYEEPGPERGNMSVLNDGEEVIGAVVRTRARVKPVFVSIGHRIGLQDAVHYVLECCRGFRLPEPIRLADKLSKTG